MQAVKEINQKRFNEAFRKGVLPKDEDGKYHFTSVSFAAEALASDPSLKLSYIVAPPRMKLYEEISTKIFSIYMRHISAEDIHVYSIDECVIDATGYLNTYHMTAHALAMTMIREVLYETGIRFEYFIEDTAKDGGSYVNITERVRRIETVVRRIQLLKQVGISKSFMELEMGKIRDISSELLDGIE